tara:strand:+ start:75 stop:668 length:594 start_codon:yes stop_codon:yes gene_type:complete
MSEFIYVPTENWKEIPRIFWSDLTSAPFQECFLCHENLIDNNLFYLIEKAVKGFNGKTIGSTIFEYAVCLSCADDMHLQLSENSRIDIANYFKKHVDFNDRANRLKELDDEAWLKECLIHQKEVSEEGECQLYAFCQGDEIVYNELPYMIRAEAIDEIVDLLSAETLDILNNFKEDLIDGPPELKELFKKGGPRILI